MWRIVLSAMSEKKRFVFARLYPSFAMGSWCTLLHVHFGADLKGDFLCRFRRYVYCSLHLFSATTSLYHRAKNEPFVLIRVADGFPITSFDNFLSTLSVP